VRSCLRPLIVLCFLLHLCEIPYHSYASCTPSVYHITYPILQQNKWRIRSHVTSCSVLSEGAGWGEVNHCSGAHWASGGEKFALCICLFRIFFISVLLLLLLASFSVLLNCPYPHPHVFMPFPFNSPILLSTPLRGEG